MTILISDTVVSVNSISWMGVIDLCVERHCNKINKLQYLESKPNQLVF